MRCVSPLFRRVAAPIMVWLRSSEASPVYANPLHSHASQCRCDSEMFNAVAIPRFANQSRSLSANSYAAAKMLRALLCRRYTDRAISIPLLFYPYRGYSVASRRSAFPKRVISELFPRTAHRSIATQSRSYTSLSSSAPFPCGSGPCRANPLRVPAHPRQDTKQDACRSERCRA